VMVGGAPRPFIGAGRSTEGAVPVKKHVSLMAAMMLAFSARYGSE
jgi:hypothetical protein